MNAATAFWIFFMMLSALLIGIHQYFRWQEIKAEGEDKSPLPCWFCGEPADIRHALRPRDSTLPKTFTDEDFFQFRVFCSRGYHCPGNSSLRYSATVLEAIADWNYLCRHPPYRSTFKYVYH